MEYLTAYMANLALRTHSRGRRGGDAPVINKTASDPENLTYKFKIKLLR